MLLLLMLLLLELIQLDEEGKDEDEEDVEEESVGTLLEKDFASESEEIRETCIDPEVVGCCG